MHTRGETTSPGDGTIAFQLLRRLVCALGYLAAAAFLCWRTLWINDSATEVAALPAFMLTSTAMVLVVLAIRTVVRPASGDEGPS